jgi:hypothetical protein
MTSSECDKMSVATPHLRSMRNGTCYQMCQGAWLWFENNQSATTPRRRLMAKYGLFILL